MSRKEVHPVEHSALGKVGHMMGGGAGSGFKWGVGGAILGAALAVGLTGGLGYGAYLLGSTAWTAGAALTTSVTFSGAATAIAAGVGSALVAGATVLSALFVTVPAIAGGTILGGGFGALRGASKQGHHVNLENAAAKYQQGYEQTRAGIHAQIAEAMQPQAYDTGVQMIGNVGAQMNDAPAESMTNAKNDNVPTNNIAAATVDHQAMVNSPELATAR